MMKRALAAAVFCALAAAAHSQSLLPNAKQQFVDQNGAPLSGGRVYTYAPGTTNPVTTWSNPQLSVANANPVVLDASGRATIWASGAVREVVKDAFGNTIIDGVTNTPAAAAAGVSVLCGSGGSPPTTAGTLLPTGGCNGSAPLGNVVGPSKSGTYNASVFADKTGKTLADSGIPTISPLEPQFGCKGDGIADDTACLQAALTAAATLGAVLQLGPYHYAISTQLGGQLSVDVEGNGLGQNENASGCPAGVSAIIVNTDINAVVLNGLTDIVRGVCFQMATSAGVRTTGAAITVGGTATSGNSGSVLARNVVVNPYNGIVVGGPTPSSQQTISTTVFANFVVNPSNIGISIGPLSSSATTADIRIKENQVGCFLANGSSTGVAIFDGAVTFADNDIFNCNVGSAWTPGVGAGAAGQIVLGTFSGVLGDSSLAHDLLVNLTSNQGLVEYINCTQCWASGVAANDQNVLIQNTTGRFAGIHSLNFVSSTFHGEGAGNTNFIIDIEGLVYGVNFTSDIICADGNGTQNKGINISALAQEISVVGNQIAECFGHLASGVTIATGASGVVVTNNDFGSTVVPIVYTPSANGTDGTIISNNLGVDNIIPPVTAAATTVLPVNPKVNLGGTGNISSFSGAWSGRAVTLLPNSAVSGLATVTGGNICNAVSLSANGLYLALFNTAASPPCWSVK